MHNAYYVVAVVYHTLDSFYESAMQYLLKYPVLCKCNGKLRIIKDVRPFPSIPNLKHAH